jgi:adenylate kinase family enzyme
MAKLRIGCSGPSGTGKTTLSEHIAKEYNIPFITTSTKPLWDKHGITSHAQLISKTMLEPSWGIDFQNEVLEFRITKLKGVDQFITDRSPVDNLAYFLTQNTHLLPPEATTEYNVKCKKAFLMFTGIIQMPFTKDIPLEDDGMRITNTYYQRLMNHAFSLAGEIMELGSSPTSHLILDYWDWEKRKYRTSLFIDHLKKKSIYA